MMSSVIKSRLFESLAYLIILVFLLIHEAGFGHALLRSPAILFSLGLFILLKHVLESRDRFDYGLHFNVVSFMLLGWLVMGFVDTLFPGQGFEFLKQTLFIYLPLTGFMMNAGRLMPAIDSRRIYVLSTGIFLTGIYNLAGPVMLFHINPEKMISIFIDQYMVSLFFLFFYFFLPPLLLCIGRDLFEKNDLKPFRDFLKLLLPFQSVLYFSHAALIVSRTAESRQYILSHYQILVILFLLIMFFGGILLHKPSYKKGIKRGIQLGVRIYSFNGEYKTGISYTGILLTLIGGLWVFNQVLDKSIAVIWLVVSGVYVYKTIQKRDMI